MEDIKKIQEFFSKPVKENSRRSPDFILTEPAEIKYTESFGSGIKAPGVLHHANEGAFLGAEGAYIIVLPGGTFYVDEDKEEAIRIYPLKDQSREFQLALDYTPFSPKYETWKSWVKEPKTLEETDVNEELSLEQKKVERFLKAIAKEFDYSIQDAANFVKSTISKMGLEESLGEASKEEETEFHKKLDTLVHDTFGKRKSEMKEEEGYSKFLKDDPDHPGGKTKGLTPDVLNKILMNVIKDLDELKQLGEGVIEEELCEKGKAYRKKRMAAGEKSSAYLNGRAVKVCKGQMKG